MTVRKELDIMSVIILGVVAFMLGSNAETRVSLEHPQPAVEQQQMMLFVHANSGRPLPPTAVYLSRKF